MTDSDIDDLRFALTHRYPELGITAVVHRNHYRVAVFAPGRELLLSLDDEVDLEAWVKYIAHRMQLETT